MFMDAWNELEELPPEVRHLCDVILLRVQILNGLEKWESAATIGVGALRHYPLCGPLYLAAAYATRRFMNVTDAKVVLLSGESVLNDDAIFHFNLACYDCLLRNPEYAKDRLRRAFALDRNFKIKALDDEDLKPLWDSL